MTGSTAAVLGVILFFVEFLAVSEKDAHYPYSTGSGTTGAVHPLGCKAAGHPTAPLPAADCVRTTRSRHSVRRKAAGPERPHRTSTSSPSVRRASEGLARCRTAWSNIQVAEHPRMPYYFLSCKEISRCPKPPSRARGKSRFRQKFAKPWD